MNLKLDELAKEELQEIIKKIAKRLSKEQYEYLQHLITECTEKENTVDISPQSLMSKTFVDEKMLQIEEWKQQIEDGKLYLDTEEFINIEVKPILERYSDKLGMEAALRV